MTRLLIIGHRGAAAVAPENTIAAFERAIHDGADGIEFDVRLSGDGVPVVIHDATLTRTSSIKGKVAALTAAELALIDVGSWFGRHERATDVDYSGERIPTLQQVLARFSQRQALLYIEMKGAREGPALPTEVVRAIQDASMRDQVIVASFDLSLIREVKRLDNQMRTAALFEPRVSRPLHLIKGSKLVEMAQASRADEIALHHALARGDIVKKAHQSRMEVVVWTVDDPGWISRARQQGIKALITNNPAAMIPK